jgi:hypothetical protein
VCGGKEGEQHEHRNAQLDAFPGPVVFFYLAAGECDFFGESCGMRYSDRGIGVGNGWKI